MKITCELNSVTDYDSRGMSKCRCGKCDRVYVSKKMFKDFLEQYPDVDAEAMITAFQDEINGTTTITVTVKQKW